MDTELFNPKIQEKASENQICLFKKLHYLDPFVIVKNDGTPVNPDETLIKIKSVKDETGHKVNSLIMTGSGKGIGVEIGKKWKVAPIDLFNLK